MLCVRKTAPALYRLCNQTVTVYHKDGDTYTHTVYTNAFLDYKKVLNIDKTGSAETNSFLFVLPCDRQTMFPGDKVLLGIGEPVETREAWAALIPSKVPGLCVVKYVDLKYWGGKIVHLEAGG